MERLTRRSDTGHAYYPRCFEEPCNGNGCKFKDCLFDERICERLAAYEDTGLSPQACAEAREAGKVLSSCDISFGRLAELLTADKDGRVVVSCWIPATERLPEDSVKECIIFVPHIPENIVGLGRYLGSGRWVLDGWYLTPEAVAYWMPLPEAPYKKALEAMKDG
nr:MAG TPA: Protein of unknown function (DUF551) [Caudoviricetes sp.]